MTDSMLVSQSESVVLVGNGPSATSRRLGDRIDTFDVVVRFNRFVLLGYEPQIGTRTTIWAINGNHKVHARTTPGNLERGVIVANPIRFGSGLPGDPVFYVRDRRDKAIERATITGKPYEVVPEDVWEHVARQMQRLTGSKRWGRPSTGSALVEYLGTQERPVHLVGFDCFKGGKESHHYFPTEMNPGHHRAEWDEAFINQAIADGKAVRL
ncbi:MAG: hypothetical protein D6746_08535 [Bacteroidetes bacterium]|nr:MAG: hypothetical protein D6746_08535 [Bacteroidota bacterium]